MISYIDVFSKTEIHLNFLKYGAFHTDSESLISISNKSLSGTEQNSKNFQKLHFKLFFFGQLFLDSL